MVTFLVFISFFINLFRWGLEKKKPLTTKSTGKEKEKKKEESDEEEEEDFALISYYQKKKEIHQIPSTRLRESEDGAFLAVGGADGTVAVVTSEDFQEVHRVTCHDLPVTGLGFAPFDITKEKGQLLFIKCTFLISLLFLELKVLLATCSADNKLNFIKVKGISIVIVFCLLFIIMCCRLDHSTLARALLIILIILIILLLLFTSTNLHFQVSRLLFQK
jgi:ABC-type multidrug transport system fused ATPase/permease subunit